MTEDDFSTVSRQHNSDETLTQNKDSSDFDSEVTHEKAKGNSYFEYWLGRTLANRYLLESVLGKGGFGVVFRAEDIKLNRPVVVKVLLEDNLDNDGIIQRFKRESDPFNRKILSR